MSQENRHIWNTLVTQAVEDEALLQKLLPHTKEKAFETIPPLANSFVELEVKWAFQGAMWRKMVSLYPNDPEVLFLYSRHMPTGPRATRAEKQAFVAHWERLKRLNDEHGIPLTSGLRKTHSLSQTYIDLGEYDKAIQNIKEQHERIAALKRAGIHDRFMMRGILASPWIAEELKRRRGAKQRDVQDR